MPSSIFWGMQHLNSNVMCALDIKTTGPDPDRHHIVELCILPLDYMLEPHKELLLCHLRIQPPDIADVDYELCEISRVDMARTMNHGYSEYKAVQIVQEWFASL